MAVEGFRGFLGEMLILYYTVSYSLILYLFLYRLRRYVSFYVFALYLLVFGVFAVFSQYCSTKIRLLHL